MKTVGVIGTGNMGKALANSIRLSKKADMVLANRTMKKAIDLANEYNCRYGTNKEAATSDYVFVGVKPKQASGLLNEIKDSFKKNCVLVSMMAGISIDKLQELSGLAKVIRILPNTPALIGEGMSLYACSKEVNKKEENYFLELMKNTGRVKEIDEHLIDAASSITGCGPAFVEIFVNALADGGVLTGVNRKDAIEYAAQMLVGTGKLILETGKHPEQLKDEVCSPGGSTIEGVRALEKNGFRSSVIEAVYEAYEKNKKLG